MSPVAAGSYERVVRNEAELRASRQYPLDDPRVWG